MKLHINYYIVVESFLKFQKYVLVQIEKAKPKKKKKCKKILPKKLLKI